MTYTTRAPRVGEKDGVDYHFVSKRIFLQMIENGDFLEYANVHGGNYYGSPLADVDALIQRGLNVLLIIDTKGMKNVMARNLPFRVTTIFVRPANLEVLRARITGRGIVDPADLQARLRTARMEIEQAGLYDHVIDSDSREHDFAELLKIYRTVTAK